MPTTLGHVGVQSLASGTWSRVRLARDLKWVALGCVIPDLPWIGQRLARTALPDADAFAIRAYAVAQSSLAISLLLALGCAFLARRPRAVALLLSFNCTLHLLLDGLQTKWGNGVLLAAPFDFRPWNAGLFWPESPVSYGLAGLGAFVLGAGLWATPEPLSHALRITPRRLLGFGALLACWGLLPGFLLSGVWAADAHSLASLAGPSDGAPSEIALDRAGYRIAPGGLGRIEPFAGEPLACRGPCPTTEGLYSFRGRRVEPATLEVSAYHAHHAGFRDMLSYLGLLGVVAVWARSALAPGRPTAAASTDPQGPGPPG